MTPTPAHFPDHHSADIDVSGADARAFLNGQFSHDVLTLAADESRFGAFCTPKGRAIALASVRATASGLLLRTEIDGADALLTTLARYVMRAKVTFGEPRPTPPRQVSEYALIAAGIPRVVQATSGRFVPQMLNLDLLDGISVRKGCYTGQEIVARTQNLGTIKRRMLPFSHASAPPPAPGTALVDSRGAKVGDVVSAVARAGGSALLAVVRLATLAEPLYLPDELTRPLLRGALPYALPELGD